MADYRAMNRNSKAAEQRKKLASTFSTPTHGGHAGVVTTPNPVAGAGTEFLGQMGKRYTINTVKGIKDVVEGTIKSNASGIQNNSLVDQPAWLGLVPGVGQLATMGNYGLGNIVNNNAFGDAIAPTDLIGIDSMPKLGLSGLKYALKHPKTAAAATGVSGVVAGATKAMASYGPSGQTGSRSGGETKQYKKIQQFFPNGGIESATPSEVINVLTSTDKRGEPVGKYFVGKSSRPGSYDDNYSKEAAKRISFNTQPDNVKAQFKGKTGHVEWWKTLPENIQKVYQNRYQAPTTTDLIQFTVDNVRKYMDPKTGNWVPGGREAFLSSHDLGHNTQVGEVAGFDTPLIGWVSRALNRAEGAGTTAVKLGL